MCIFGVESINIMSLSRKHVTHVLLYDNELYMLKSNKIYVMLCYGIMHKSFPTIPNQERSGSVVECLTRDRRAAGWSLTGVTALWSLSKTHLS